MDARKMKDKLNDFKRKMQDKKNQARIKAQVEKALKEGKAKIEWLEKQMKDPENHAKVRAEIAKAKAQLNDMKAKYKEKEKKAVEYTKANPKKALAVAAAAGILAGTLMGAFKKRR
jgi:ElaB/YqjD/DUF883 family membrane-anchored ribosome-binding protein